MNFFFPIHNNYLKWELCVPRFQNYKKTNDKFKLFSAEIKENKWEVKLVDCDFNKDFFFLTNKNFSNDKIFFLAELKIRENFFLNELKNFNNYTDTEPDYRSNLNIENVF